MSIAKCCFKHYPRLLTLTFEPGSKVSSLGESALNHCASIQWICLPSSTDSVTEPILKSCLSHWNHLANIVLYAGPNDIPKQCRNRAEYVQLD
jgi:hypothetical protein